MAYNLPLKNYLSIQVMRVIRVMIGLLECPFECDIATPGWISHGLIYLFKYYDDIARVCQQTVRLTCLLTQ